MQLKHILVFLSVYDIKTVKGISMKQDSGLTISQ